MKKNVLGILSIIVILGATNWIQAAPKPSAHVGPVSGNIVQGYRVLDIENTTEKTRLTVYRGDYIKFVFDQSIGEPILSIPALSIEQKLLKNPNKTPYFKMKRTGTFQFSLGRVTGTIEVVEYRQPNYKAVSSKEAAELITNIQPFILDVRTPSEFKSGHLKNAVLIPVQELQRRVHEISKFKNEDILIYCATGNRSTVASKILIDHGFKRIINLRYGIYQWAKMNYPVTR